MTDRCEFVTSLIVQVPEVIPEEYKKYELVFQNLMAKYMQLAYDDITNNEDENIQAEREFIVQVIGEWSFHKIVDMLRLEIPTEHFDFVLQKITSSVYKTAISAVKKKLEQQEILDKVEKACIKSYFSAMNSLSKVVKDEELKSVLRTNYKLYQKQNVATLFKTKVNPIFILIGVVFLFMKTCISIVTLTPTDNLNTYLTTIFLILIVGLFTWSNDVIEKLGNNILLVCAMILLASIRYFTVLIPNKYIIYTIIVLLFGFVLRSFVDATVKILDK